MNILLVGFDSMTIDAFRAKPWSDTVRTFSTTHNVKAPDLPVVGRRLYVSGLDQLLRHFPVGHAPLDIVHEAARRGLWWSALTLDRPSNEYLPNIRDHYDAFRVLVDGFYSALEAWRIDAVIFRTIPHDSGCPVLYEVARAMGVTTVMGMQSLFPNRFFLARSPAEIGLYEERFMVFDEMRDCDTIVASRSVPFYMRKRKARFPLSRGARTLISSFNALRRVRGMQNRLHLASKLMLEDVGTRVAERAEAARSVDSFPEERPYIYFPLHLDPEMTTVPLGGMFWNNLDAVQQLAVALPDNWTIVAKENPKQNGYARGPAFWHRLDRVPRTTFASRGVDSLRLIDESRAVATVTGTAGWEALQAGKPVFHFGDAWYRSLPGARDARDPKALSDIASATGPTQHELSRALRRLSKTMGFGVVNNSYAKLVSSFDAKHNAELVAESFTRYLAASDSL